MILKVKNKPFIPTNVGKRSANRPRNPREGNDNVNIQKHDPKRINKPLIISLCLVFEFVII